MKRTLVIFKKELIDTLRDRRTLIFMVVLPLLVFPLLMNIITKLTVSQTKKAEEKVIRVGLITEGNGAMFKKMLNERQDMTVNEEVAAADINDLIQAEKLDFIIQFEKDFDRKIAQKAGGIVMLHFKGSSERDIMKKRIRNVFDQYRDNLLNARLHEMELEKSFIAPLDVQEVDLASVKEKLGERLGGFLPYIFVIFCFIGAMYPAIDLAAGEKEQATLETLLSSPAGRMQIVVGKFLVITGAGIVSAILSIVGLYIAVKSAVKLPANVLNSLLKMIRFESIALLLSLLIPLCVFFAAVLLSLSIYAKSFKEAQSLVTPLNFMVIIPVAIGMVPGIKLTAVTALIPILNVSLATKDIISGTIHTGLLFEVYGSLFVLTALSLFFCAKWFKREDVIFRGI